jgi:hypothetical protein
MLKKILLFLVVLLFAVLACSIPQKGDDIKLNGTVTHSAPTPVDKVDAKEAIQAYAQDVLGFEISNMFAGGTAGELSLPVSLQDGVDLAIDLAGTTYFGVWSGGLASLSFGDSDLSGDFQADVREGSLGVFVVTQMIAPPENSTSALDLIQQTYPGLSGYSWTETPVERGYGFTTVQAENIGVQSWSVELTGTTINAGVVPGLLNNQSLVWVVAASGVLAAPFGQ